nr:PREDICTED: bidirectional sugar transporter SWEET10-like [Nicotiana sylvestris]
MLFLTVVGGFGAIILIAQFLFKGVARGQVVGWVCLVFSLCVFVAPLCIVTALLLVDHFMQRKVIKTKSVEYMPLLLSVFLTLSAVMWFFYGLLLKDINIAAPNILGFIFGILQIVLYVIYNKKEKHILKEQNLPELQNHVIILDDNKKLPELTEEQKIDIMKLSKLVSSLHENASAAAKEENLPKLQSVQA